ncbi:oligosaccharide flippase family protein [Aestuariibaculum lutulentum]|uniref:Oligosaccharide flippase family protein n=1 Tax=Aestuariibaculum lutulentum TaxID=2920935 RepID=A0ABS9RGK4_9FLAO|nr:polysaccharide biosynthesis C-terminal domain-containing protein [Aestuariibaculum lutulentum]MCH4552077.1 oligosaccharide flippase family protein [Aestuariibaculum lutulentum]
MGTLKRFFKDTIIYGIAAILPRAINIFLVRLHTDVFGAEKYAINTDYYVYAAYLNAILTYGLETAFFRFFSKEKEKGKVVSTSFISLLITTCLFLVVALFFADNIASIFGFESILHVKILIWTVFFDTIVVIPFAYLRVTNQPIKFTGIKIFNISVFAILNVLFLWIIPNGILSEDILPKILHFYEAGQPQVIYIFLANVIASFFTFVLLIPILFKMKWTLNPEILKKLLMYGLPIMVGSLAYVTNENVDKLFLGDLIGKKEMGIYAACYKLGVFMTLYIFAFRLGAEPFFFNHAKEVNAKENYATILKWFTILGAIFMLIVVCYIDLFSSILLGQKEYFEALSIVPIILLANLCLGIYNNLAIWYKLTDRTSYGMYISILGAIITVVFNLTMIPKIGFMASAWATLAAYGTMMLISYFIGKKYYPVPYDLKRIGGYLILSTLISFISFQQGLRGDYLINTGLVLVFLTIIYISEKKQIKQLLKR